MATVEAVLAGAAPGEVAQAGRRRQWRAGGGGAEVVELVLEGAQDTDVREVAESTEPAVLPLSPSVAAQTTVRVAVRRAPRVVEAPLVGRLRAHGQGIVLAAHQGGHRRRRRRARALSGHQGRVHRRRWSRRCEG